MKISSTISVDLHFKNGLWYALATSGEYQSIISVSEDKELCVENAKSIMKRALENIAKKNKSANEVKLTAITEEGREILYEKVSE